MKKCIDNKIMKDNIKWNPKFSNIISFFLNETYLNFPCNKQTKKNQPTLKTECKTRAKI